MSASLCTVGFQERKHGILGFLNSLTPEPSVFCFCGIVINNSGSCPGQGSPDWRRCRQEGVEPHHPIIHRSVTIVGISLTAGSYEALRKGSALPAGTVVMEPSYRNPLLGELRHHSTAHCSITCLYTLASSSLWSKLQVTVGSPRFLP